MKRTHGGTLPGCRENHIGRNLLHERDDRPAEEQGAISSRDLHVGHVPRRDLDAGVIVESFVTDQSFASLVGVATPLPREELWHRVIDVEAHCEARLVSQLAKHGRITRHMTYAIG